MRFGLEAALGSVMSATRQTLQEAGLAEEALANVYAGIGLAGTGQRGARAALEAWRHPFAGAWFEGDGYLALLGAFGEGDGGIVIAGTGSIALTHYKGRTKRIGGYGFPVSDEGSGADLGLNAIRHSLRTLDGRAASSEFSADVLARFAHDPAALIAWMETATATDYAALAPLVARHAQAKDTAARALMHQAGSQIAGLVESLFASGVKQVALTGGLADVLKTYLPSAIANRLSTPLADAISGGVFLAKKRASLSTPRSEG